MKDLYERVLKKILADGLKSRFLGSHAHRIVPGYEGGEYIKENVIYITQKEHSIVHFLRWKLYGKSEDYRAYKMIGVGPSGLTHDDRVDHGKRSFELKLGFHNKKWNSERKEWIAKALETQKKSNSKQTFYYWSTKEGRRERASMGGKASFGKNLVFLKQMCSFKDSNLARLASQKAGKKNTTNGVKNRKFKTDEERINFINKNPEWYIGMTARHTKKRRFRANNGKEVKSFYTAQERNIFIEEYIGWKTGIIKKSK